MTIQRLVAAVMAFRSTLARAAGARRGRSIRLRFLRMVAAGVAPSIVMTMVGLMPMGSSAGAQEPPPPLQGWAGTVTFELTTPIEPGRDGSGHVETYTATLTPDRFIEAWTNPLAADHVILGWNQGYRVDVSIPRYEWPVNYATGPDGNLICFDSGWREASGAGEVAVPRSEAVLNRSTFEIEKGPAATILEMFFDLSAFVTERYHANDDCPNTGPVEPWEKVTESLSETRGNLTTGHSGGNGLFPPSGPGPSVGVRIEWPPPTPPGEPIKLEGSKSMTTVGFPPPSWEERYYTTKVSWDLTLVYALNDQDGDGVQDDADQCPTVPGTAAKYGCPIDPAIYAPLVHIHPDESHFPMRADDFIAHSSLNYRHACRDDEQLASEGSVDARRLGSGDYSVQSRELSYTGTSVGAVATCVTGSETVASNEFSRPRSKYCTETDSAACRDERFASDEGFYLDLIDDYRGGGSNGGGSFDNTVPVYYEYRPGHHIIYWFHWGYSIPNHGKFPLRHEGDWERIVVLLDANDEATMVRYHYHHWTTDVPWSDVPKHADADGNEHPVVYAAKEGHGSYWREDCNFSVTWAAPGVSPLTSDVCADGPDDWETWRSTVDATKQGWYGYGGAWGDVGPGVPGLASDTVGPPGPGAANGLAASEPEIENVVLEQIHDDGLFRWDDRLKTWVMSLDDRIKDKAGDLIGWLAGGVDISLFSTRIALGQLTATADGSLEGSLALPRNVPPGVHTLVLSGWHPSAQYMQEVRVLVEVPGPPVTPEPPTPKPPAPKPPTPKPPALPTGTGGGYWLLERDGDIAAYGAAAAYETAKPNLAAGASAVALAARPDGKGLWVLTSDGDVIARGEATDFGRVDLAQLTKPGERVATMSATPTGKGLWVFTTAGRILSFGDALPADEMTGSAEILALDLDGPIIHSAATPTGKGAYLVASDGGVFTIGDARFIDSVRGQLSKLFGPPGMPDLPVVGITPDPDGDGYWMVAADGGVFSFRTPFRGSLPAVVPFDRLAAPVNGMVPYGNGYLLVAGDGGVFTFSNKPFQGSGAGNLDSPVVAIASA